MIAALLALIAPTDGRLFDPASGYRVASYRGVIPAPPPGVHRLDDDAAAHAHRLGKALFVDLTPAAGAVRDSETGRWRLAQPHGTIPGAHWFPEAGRGPPDRAIDAWFARGIERLTGGSKNRFIIAFCLSDCWMSWNASWKIRRLGYRHVGWYANGIDGWLETGRSLATVLPEPG